MNATTIQPAPKLLLDAWERGATRPLTIRALLLLREVQPHAEPETLAQLSIGHRDAHLLSLRELLFGSRFECLTRCGHCDELIELNFQADDIRAEHAQPGLTHHLETGGYNVTFRLPDSTDLLAIEGEIDPKHATQALLARCVLDVTGEADLPAVADINDGMAYAIGARMSELDPQAEVVLELACPVCQCRWQVPFDIVSYLWSELDAWARSVLREVHVLARAYGWSESEIVALTPLRRRFYLDLIGA